MPPKVASSPISNKENQQSFRDSVAHSNGSSDLGSSNTSVAAPKKILNKSKASFGTFKKLLLVYCAESRNENISLAGSNDEQRIRQIVGQVLKNIKEENLDSLVVNILQALAQNQIQFAKTRLELQIKRYAHALSDEKFAQKFNIMPVIIYVRDKRGVESSTSSILTRSEEREMYKLGEFDLSILRSEIIPPTTVQKIKHTRHSPSSKKLVIDNPGVSFATFTQLLNAYCEEKSKQEQHIKRVVREALSIGGEESLGELVSRLQFAFEQNGIILANTELALRIQKHAYYKEDENFPKLFKIASPLSITDKTGIDKLKIQKNIQRNFKGFLNDYCEKFGSKNSENNETEIGEQKIVAIVRDILALEEFKSIDDENFRDFVSALKAAFLRKKIDFTKTEFLNTQFKREIKNYAYHMGDEKFPQKFGISGILTDAEKSLIDQKKQQQKEMHCNKIKMAWQQEREETERRKSVVQEKAKLQALYQKKDERNRNSAPLTISTQSHQPQQTSSTRVVSTPSQHTSSIVVQKVQGERDTVPNRNGKKNPSAVIVPAPRQDNRIGTMFRAQLENYVGLSLEGLSWFEQCIEWFKRTFRRNHIQAVEQALAESKDPAKDTELYSALQKQLNPAEVNGQKHVKTPIDPHGTLGGTLVAYLHSQKFNSKSHSKIIQAETPEKVLEKAGFVLKK